jgi:hypothetical protein
MTLPESVRMIRDGLQAIGFGDRDFRNSQWIRLRVLERHMSEGRLSPELRWAAGEAGAQRGIAWATERTNSGTDLNREPVPASS